MNGKGINFDDKKIKRSDFYKNKKVFQIDNIEANKTLVSKEKRRIHSNTLLDKTISLLGRYV